MSTLIYLDLVMAVLALFVAYRLYIRNSLPLPPGPKGFPIIGNAFDMPAIRSWETFARWGDQYGPISSATVFGQHFVILNDYAIAHDLLHKRGTLYADRPSLEMTHLSGWDRVLGTAKYGPQFREFRKLLARVIGSKSGMMKFYPAEELQSNMFLRRVLQNPDDVGYASRKTAGAMVLHVGYGYKILENTPDPFVDLADKGMADFVETAEPGAFLVNVLPILKYVPSWFPGSGFKTLARTFHQTCDEMAEAPFQYARNQLAKARGQVTENSLISDLLSQENLSAEDLYSIKWAGASLYSAGTDTTGSVVTCYFLAVIKFPVVQQRAWAEMDAVVGQERLPDFGDRDSLPYLEAVCKELYRWLPIVPLGLPHLVMADDVYGNYRIPKDTVVMANIWRFLHDEDVYKDPFSFNPDRFLGPDPERDPTEFGLFGFGRRTCPGSHLADVSVWINVAKAVAALDVSRAIDKDGKAIDPVVEMTNGFVIRPLPFRCAVKARSAKVATTIQEALCHADLSAQGVEET